MPRKTFFDLRLWNFLILGVVLIYLGTSMVFFGKISFEALNINTKIEITTDKLYSSLKDFKRDGTVITSTSTDPWIELNFDKALFIKDINIEISSLNVEHTSAQIYYASDNKSFSGNQYVETTMKTGSNIINIKDNIKIKSLRLDLTNSQGVSISDLKMEVGLSKKILSFWTSLVFIVIIYIVAVFKIYYSNRNNSHEKTAKRVCNDNDWGSTLLKEIFLNNETKPIKLFGVSFIISLCFYLPYIVNLLYSIDDYYLNQVYDLNINSLGYNFYSTGRFLEAVLAQAFYYMNIQPLTKPIGPLLFIASMSLIGVCFTQLLRIRSFYISLGFVLLFTTNSFLSEIFSYSIVSAYSAFAVIALGVGLVFGELYARKRKLLLLLFSIIGYVCSLTVYQIFYPIVGVVLIYKLLVPNDFLNDIKKKKDEFYKQLIPLGIYVLAFVFYGVILQVCFHFHPPTLKYNGGSIGEFLNNIQTTEYWNLLYSNIKIYIFSDNPFNSKIVNWLLWILAFSTFVTYVLKKGIPNLVPDRTLRAVIVSFILIASFGLCLSFGFSILRPAEISSRSLTAFGLYQGLLILFTYNLLSALHMKLARKKVLITLVALIILLGSAGRIGRSSMDQHRLNNLEHSLVTRIVDRLESNSNFTSNAKLVIVGQPQLGNLSHTNFGDYNTPAIQQFGKVFLFNEISGYSFTIPNDVDIEKANSILEGMASWPSANSIKYVDGMFIIKLS